MINPKEDLSHIELPHSGNISSLNAVKAYRVGEAHISTEEKREQEYKEKLLIFLLFFCLYVGLGLAHLHLTSQMRCSHLTAIFKFSAKNLTHYSSFFVFNIRFSTS